MNKVKEWRKNNPEKYKEQKDRELYRRKQRRRGETITYNKIIPWNIKSTEEKKVTRLLSRCRKRARNKGISYDPCINNLIIPTHCPYLNIELDYECDTYNKNMASIDRIDPELGYVEGNVQIVSMLANQMKSHATKEELVLFAESVLKLHKPPAPLI